MKMGIKYLLLTLQLIVNGPQKPNQFGRDVYNLFVDRTGTNVSNEYLGSKSLINILSGKDELEYENYSKGQQFEF